MTQSEPGSKAGIDYAPCRYGASRIRFRGPLRKVSSEALVFLGGAETYGRFIQHPFPELVEKACGAPSINLGCAQAGIDAYLSSPDLIDICSQAKATVIQIMGAANMSNRFYSVDPRHNNRFLRASKKLKEIYPEVDFTLFSTTTELLTELAQVGPDRIPLVRQEMQSAWVARMRTFLTQIEGRKILLWLSDHAPFTPQNRSTVLRDPLFVDQAMLRAASLFADDVLEVVATNTEVSQGRSEMIYADHERAESLDILGPVVHRRVAETLQPILNGQTAPLLLSPSSQIA